MHPMIKPELTKGNICEIMHGLRNIKEVNVVFLATGASRERLTAVGRDPLASCARCLLNDIQGSDD